MLLKAAHSSRKCFTVSGHLQCAEDKKEKHYNYTAANNMIKTAHKATRIVNKIQFQIQDLKLVTISSKTVTRKVG